MKKCIILFILGCCFISSFGQYIYPVTIMVDSINSYFGVTTDKILQHPDKHQSGS